MIHHISISLIVWLPLRIQVCNYILHIKLYSKYKLDIMYYKAINGYLMYVSLGDNHICCGCCDKMVMYQNHRNHHQRVRTSTHSNIDICADIITHGKTNSLNEGIMNIRKPSMTGNIELPSIPDIESDVDNEIQNDNDYIDTDAMISKCVAQNEIVAVKETLGRDIDIINNTSNDAIISKNLQMNSVDVFKITRNDPLLPTLQ